MTSDEIFEYVVAMFEERGDRSYGENVAEMQHALQSILVVVDPALVA